MKSIRSQGGSPAGAALAVVMRYSVVGKQFPALFRSLRSIQDSPLVVVVKSLFRMQRCLLLDSHFQVLDSTVTIVQGISLRMSFLV